MFAAWTMMHSPLVLLELLPQCVDRQQHRVGLFRRQVHGPQHLAVGETVILLASPLHPY